MQRLRSGRLYPRRQARRYECPTGVDNEVCQHVLQGVWNLTWDPSTHHLSEAPPKSYTDYWRKCILTANDLGLYLQNRFVAVELVNIVRNNQNQGLDVIRDEILMNYPNRGTMTDAALGVVDKARATKALEFAIRLWLHLPPLFHISGTAQVQNLHDWTKDRLPTKSSDGQFIEGALSDDFCITHLVRKGGMVIVWEDDISQHLQLDKGNHIHIFRHSAVLTSMDRQTTGYAILRS